MISNVKLLESVKDATVTRAWAWTKCVFGVVPCPAPWSPAAVHDIGQHKENQVCWPSSYCRPATVHEVCQYKVHQVRWPSSSCRPATVHDLCQHKVYQVCWLSSSWGDRPLVDGLSSSLDGRPAVDRLSSSWGDRPAVDGLSSSGWPATVYDICHHK